MAEILKQQLPGGSWWEGYDGTSPVRKTKIGEGEVSYASAFNFQLFDKQHKKIFEYEHDPRDKDSHLQWFYSNTQPSEDHPYFIADIDALCAHNL